MMATAPSHSRHGYGRRSSSSMCLARADTPRYRQSITRRLRNTVWAVRPGRRRAAFRSREAAVRVRRVPNCAVSRVRSHQGYGCRAIAGPATTCVRCAIVRVPFQAGPRQVGDGRALDRSTAVRGVRIAMKAMPPSPAETCVARAVRSSGRVLVTQSGSADHNLGRRPARARRASMVPRMPSRSRASVTSRRG